MTEANQAAYNPFDPANYSAGGFLDNVDAVITDAKVDTWEHAEGECFLHVAYTPEGEGEEPHTQYYRIGTLANFTPSSDKSEAIPAPDAKINNKSGAALFFRALIAAGYPKAEMSRNVRTLIGLRVHLNALEQEEIKQDGKDFKGKKKDGPRKVVLPTKIHGRVAAGQGASTSAPRPNGSMGAPTPAAVAVDGNAEAAAVQAILDEIAANSGVALKRNLPTAMFRRISGNENTALRNAATKLCATDSWLAQGPWQFDAGKGELRAL